MVTIDPEFAALIPPLSQDERQRLEESLLDVGCLAALVTWHGLLLDGHHRLPICLKYNIPHEIVELNLPDRLGAMIWIRQHQVSRRNLTDDQRAMNAAALADLLSTQAKQERAKKGGQAGGVGRPKNSLDTDGVPKLSDRSNKSVVKAAKANKVSERKVRAATHVRKVAPDLAAKVVAGEISLRVAERIIAQQEEAAAKGAIPADTPSSPMDNPDTRRMTHGEFIRHVRFCCRQAMVSTKTGRWLGEALDRLEDACRVTNDDRTAVN
jgi:hypothetical protein